MTPPTILDAIDLATRAAYYRRVWLGEPIPNPDFPDFLWPGRDGYYAIAHRDTFLDLRRRAEEALFLAVLGVEGAWSDDALDLTPAEIRRRGEWLETRVECGLLLADNLVEKLVDNAVADVLDRLEERAECTPEHDSPIGYFGVPSFGAWS